MAGRHSYWREGGGERKGGLRGKEGEVWEREGGVKERKEWERETDTEREREREREREEN